MIGGVLDLDSTSYLVASSQSIPIVFIKNLHYTYVHSTSIRGCIPYIHLLLHLL